MGLLNDLWNDVKDIGQDIIDVNVGLVSAAFDPFGITSNIGHEVWKWTKHQIIPDMRRDREAMVSSSTNARRLVYGRTRVGGQMVYAATGGDKNEYIYLAVVFAGHAIDGFEEIWYDDKRVATLTGGVWVCEGIWDPQWTSFNTYDGTQTTAGTLPGHTLTGCTADHKLLGCAYGLFVLRYNETLFASGLPNIKATLRGKKVYDPRTGLTVWSDNPALCIRDYMSVDEIHGGMGCDSDELPSDANITTAANICDQTIAAAGGEKRYTLNGVVVLDTTPAAIVKSMLGAMAGQGLYSGGVWNIYAGAATASVATLDESWLNGGISFNLGTNKNDRINTVKGTYTDPAQYWADIEFPAVVNSAYVADDGEELTADISLPFTNSPTMAQRLAGIEMQKSRYGMSMSYPCNYRAASLNALDTVAVNNTLLGWSGKLFKVMSAGFSAMGGVPLELVEDHANIWADPSTYGTLTPTAMTNLPDPWTVAAPAAVSVTSNLYTGVMSNDTKQNIVIDWTQAEAGTTFDIIQDGVILQNVNDTTYTIPDLPPGDHVVGVRSRNGIDAVSGWVMSTVVIPAFTDPSETLRLLNGDISEDKLAQYLLQNISITQLLDTYDQSVVPGVFTSGATGTLPDIILGTAKQIVLMAGEVGKQTSQIELLNDRISLKLNSNGHVAGMAIGWDESGDVSETVFINDVFKICLPDGSGIKQAFTVGTVGGISTVGVNGNMIIDGTLSVDAFVVGDLTSGVTTIIGNVVDTGYINALGITAASVTATTLSAISSNLGTVTAGSINIPDTTTATELISLGYSNNTTGFYSTCTNGANVARVRQSVEQNPDIVSKDGYWTQITPEGIQWWRCKKTYAQITGTTITAKIKGLMIRPSDTDDLLYAAPSAVWKKISMVNA
jgi:hypothetical protein